MASLPMKMYYGLNVVAYSDAVKNEKIPSSLLYSVRQTDLSLFSPPVNGTLYVLYCFKKGAVVGMSPDEYRLLCFTRQSNQGRLRKITPLWDVVDISITTDKAIARPTAWKRYRMDVPVGAWYSMS